MQIIPFQAIYPNLDFITSADSFFDNVKEEYNEYYASGFFNKTAQEALYIYQIFAKNRTYTGLIACADVKDFLAGRIKKHEETLSDKEQRQIQLILRRKAAVKPVLLAYPQVDSILKYLVQLTKKRKPFFEVHFEKELSKHLFWEIKEGAAIQKIQSLFKKEVPCTYIADGHHRTSSVAALHERLQQRITSQDYSQLLCAFFPSSDLEILDFNRVVDGLSEISITSFMARVSQVCNIKILKRPEKPTQKHDITMFINREWFKLSWKKKVLSAFKTAPATLDSMLLNEKILQAILGVEDVRTDLRVAYIENPRGLEGVRKETLKKDSNIGFCLYPVQFEEVVALANVGLTLPPKSTWFEPRMKNGLIVKDF